MAKEPENDPAQPASAEGSQSHTQPTPVETTKPAEGNDKGDDANKQQVAQGEGSEVSAVTDEQWRSMMDTLMSVYDYREAE